MTEPLVSVKMLTYNHAPYIAQAIEGVLMQKTTFPFELIIGEDCSTDGTRDIVLDYANRYPDIIRVITSDKNVGAANNSLRTEKHCRGKYLAWCEGDDYWHRDDKLQMQADYLESHPECGLVCSDYDVFHTENSRRISGFVRNRKWHIPLGLSVADFVKPQSYLPVAILTCTVMARKEMVDAIKTEDTFLHQSGTFKMGDTQLWAELSERSQIYFFQDSLVTHQILTNSAANSKNRYKKMRFLLSSAEMSLYLCNKYKVEDLIKNYYESQINHYLIRSAFYSNDAALAERFRNQKEKMDWRETIMYRSTKSPVLYFLCRWICSVCQVFKKEYRAWQ